VSAPDAGSGPPEPTSYAGSLNELEAILGQLDSDDVDVDELAALVARAADLIRFCRSRVDGARLQIESVLIDVDRPATDEG
jgi:exodeoxyribonuclease VII small subunit